MDKDTLFGKKVSEDERVGACSVATGLDKCTLEETKQLLGTFERCQALAQARGFTAQRQNVTNGAKSMWA
eukprot:9193796-Pyramimonas_sp.AAC.1